MDVTIAIVTDVTDKSCEYAVRNFLAMEHLIAQQRIVVTIAKEQAIFWRHIFMAEKLAKTESEWKQQLTPEQYHVTREAGTEPAFTGKYWKTKDAGTYHCVCCGEPLFDSSTKFDSGTGWPSFFKPVEEGKVEEHKDSSYGMVRTEARCASAAPISGMCLRMVRRPPGCAIA